MKPCALRGVVFLAGFFANSVTAQECLGVEGETVVLQARYRTIGKDFGLVLSEDQKKIGALWSNRQEIARENARKHTRFYHVPYIVEEINRRVCGRRVNGPGQGLVELLKSKVDGRVFQKGVSVGSGVGRKEMNILQEGLVSKFDLYELSEGRIEEGRKLAASRGFQDRAHFICSDAFEELGDAEEVYDFVHWNDSLHHMFDVSAAVAWSKRVLRPGGVFFMQEYAGPNRLQYTPDMLKIASGIRHALPSRYLKNPHKPEELLLRDVLPPDLEKLKKRDPSEAPDSDDIIRSVKQYFPDATIVPLGGVVFFAALNDVLANIDCDAERELLDSLLLIDELAASSGNSLYMAALAFR